MELRESFPSGLSDLDRIVAIHSGLVFVAIAVLRGSLRDPLLMGYSLREGCASRIAPQQALWELSRSFIPLAPKPPCGFPRTP